MDNLMITINIINNKLNIIWRSPNLSELTPYKVSLGLTHLSSETPIYGIKTSVNSMW